MALNTTANNNNTCSVQPLRLVSDQICASNDNVLKEKDYIPAFIKNEFSFSKRTIACIFDIVFIGILYVMTYDFFINYKNQVIVDSLYVLYPYFYYVCIPTLAKGTTGMLLMNLRCVRSDGEHVEFQNYNSRFLAVHFLFIMHISLNIILNSFHISDEFIPILTELKAYSLYAYFIWLGICALSLFLSPLKHGIYEKLSRTMVISYRMK